MQFKIQELSSYTAKLDFDIMDQTITSYLTMVLDTSQLNWAELRNITENASLNTNHDTKRKHQK